MIAVAMRMPLGHGSHGMVSGETALAKDIDFFTRILQKNDGNIDEHGDETWDRNDYFMFRQKPHEQAVGPRIRESLCEVNLNYQRFCSMLSPMFQMLQSTKKIKQVCVKHMKSA